MQKEVHDPSPGCYSEGYRYYSFRFGSIHRSESVMETEAATLSKHWQGLLSMKSSMLFTTSANPSGMLNDGYMRRPCLQKTRGDSCGDWS